jgi:hypothetical protein
MPGAARLATRREGDYDDGLHPTRAGAASLAPAAGLTGEVRHRRRVRTHPGIPPAPGQADQHRRPRRGELISQLGRLRGELRAADETTSPPPRRFRSWRRPLQAGRRQRRSPTRQRPPA